MAKEIRLTGVGNILQELRSAANMTLRDAADRLGWSPGTLSKYENNKVGVSLEILEQIADVLGQPKEALALRCLQARYSSLAKKNSPIEKALGQLLQTIEREVGKPQSEKRR